MTYIYPNYGPIFTPNNTNPWPIPVNNVLIMPAIPMNITSAIKRSLGEAFAPVAAGKSSAHVIFILDDSGSMQSCRDGTIEGFNGYLAGQKEDSVKTGIKTFVSLYKFDGYKVVTVYDHENVHDTPPLTKETYNPQGMTNLLDAIGAVLIQVNNRLIAQPESERESVIVTILTDGGENSSKTFGTTDVKQMVEKSEGKLWGFMFLGANIDAFGTSSQLGFNSHNTMQYSTNNMAATINNASLMTNRMKGAFASGEAKTRGLSDTYASVGFTDQERVSSNE